MLMTEMQTVMFCGIINVPMGNYFHHDKEQQEAILKRNAQQEQQAKKVMKVYADAVKNKGATSGTIVTLKVDH